MQTKILQHSLRAVLMKMTGISTSQYHHQHHYSLREIKIQTLLRWNVSLSSPQSRETPAPQSDGDQSGEHLLLNERSTPDHEETDIPDEVALEDNTLSPPSPGPYGAESGETKEGERQAPKVFTYDKLLIWAISSSRTLVPVVVLRACNSRSLVGNMVPSPTSILARILNFKQIHSHCFLKNSFTHA